MFCAIQDAFNPLGILTAHPLLKRGGLPPPRAPGFAKSPKMYHFFAHSTKPSSPSFSGAFWSSFNWYARWMLSGVRGVSGASLAKVPVYEPSA